MTSSVYPTGTTIYNPDKCWNGYTLASPMSDVRLVDMNGNVINHWTNLHASPPKILPGGYVMGSTEDHFPDSLDLIQVDWDGNIVWYFNKYELYKESDRKSTWRARQHHDYQREGNPVGYYVPGMEPLVGRGNTLLLSHKNLKNLAISDKLLIDDTFIEVTWDGEVVWEWVCSDHFDEMGFSEEAKNTLARNPGIRSLGGQEVDHGDWMHINSISLLGPNKWCDQGDERFHPDNIIWSGRNTNIIGITEKKTGKIVWQVGPDYTATEALRSLGQIIGQHHAHMIPRGLPGEGNILVFDNGGWAGYGAPNPGSPTGFLNALRDYSRILEFDPVTLQIVWQYSPREAGLMFPEFAHKLYSSFISSAQRLPNGNTLITEGAGGRVFEVTPEHEIVWEYVCPHGAVYRAYRVPYDWIPQVKKPLERAIKQLDNSKFKVPGSKRSKTQKVTTVRNLQTTKGRNSRTRRH